MKYILLVLLDMFLFLAGAMTAYISNKLFDIIDSRTKYQHTAWIGLGQLCVTILILRTPLLIDLYDEIEEQHDETKITSNNGSLENIGMYSLGFMSIQSMFIKKYFD